MGTIRSKDLKSTTTTNNHRKKMAPIIAHYKTNNFPTAFEPLEVETGNMDEAPMSRTHQYRKVMKPMLERKRRARINKCLDELKDLMVVALQTEGESITKLEKADVLELTVRHLKKLRRQQMLTISPHLNQDKYRSGFTACATEVSRCLGSLPTVDANTRSKLMNHLGQRLASVSASDPPPHQPPSGLTIRVPVPTYPVPVKVSPQSPLQDSDLGYNSGR